MNGRVFIVLQYTAVTHKWWPAVHIKPVSCLFIDREVRVSKCVSKCSVMKTMSYQNTCPSIFGSLQFVLFYSSISVHLSPNGNVI